MNLYLDHFCVGIEAEYFDEYAALKDLIPETKVQTVQSGEKSWRGVYIESFSGTYLELLRRGGNFPDAGLGFGFSELGNEVNLNGLLRENFPDIVWEEKEIYYQKDEPWFGITEPTKQNLKPQVQAWTMEYRGVRREMRRKRINSKITPISSFRSMEMLFPQDAFDQLNDDMYRWIPAQRTTGNNEIVMKIPCYQMGDFTLIGTVNSNVRYPTIAKIVCSLQPGRTVQEYHGRSFGISASGNEAQFDFFIPS